MYKELSISESEGVWAAYLALCDLKEETERLQAACAAKEAELAELRGQTSELFGARLEAEGMGEEAVTSAKAMWQSDPQSAAQAVLGCDIAEAANPWGCNQYGHRKGHNGGQSGSVGERKDMTNDNKKATLTDTEAESLTDDLFEIAMEEGGYEKLYDVPKEKLKAVIKQELMKSGSREMFGDVDTGEDGNPAKYRWWRKNVKRIVDSLDDDVKSSSTLEELLEEEDIVNAANPYGCNQHGHEWRMPHGGKSSSPKQPELQRVPGGRAFSYRPVKQEKAKSPEKKTEKVSEHKTETREAYKDNPNFKREVNNYIRRMKDITSREKTAYKEITSGKLSDEQTQQKLKEWADAQNEYYQVLQEFANEGVQLDIDESDEISKLDIQSEDQIMQHFEDIEKRYPQAVK